MGSLKRDEQWIATQLAEIDRIGRLSGSWRRRWRG